VIIDTGSIGDAFYGPLAAVVRTSVGFRWRLVTGVLNKHSR